MARRGTLRHGLPGLQQHGSPVRFGGRRKTLQNLAAGPSGDTVGSYYALNPVYSVQTAATSFTTGTTFTTGSGKFGQVYPARTSRSSTLSGGNAGVKERTKPARVLPPESLRARNARNAQEPLRIAASFEAGDEAREEEPIEHGILPTIWGGRPLSSSQGGEDSGSPRWVVDEGVLKDPHERLVWSQPVSPGRLPVGPLQQPVPRGTFGGSPLELRPGTGPAEAQLASQSPSSLLSRQRRRTATEQAAGVFSPRGGLRPGASRDSPQSREATAASRLSQTSLWRKQRFEVRSGTAFAMSRASDEAFSRKRQVMELLRADPDLKGHGFHPPPARKVYLGSSVEEVTAAARPAEDGAANAALADGAPPAASGGAEGGAAAEASGGAEGVEAEQSKESPATPKEQQAGASHPPDKPGGEGA